MSAAEPLLAECDRCKVTHDATELHELAGVRLRAEHHRLMQVCRECMTSLAEIGARRERGFGDVVQIPGGSK